MISHAERALMLKNKNKALIEAETEKAKTRNFIVGRPWPRNKERGQGDPKSYFVQYLAVSWVDQIISG